MEAVGLHDFEATAEDELSFKKGSILKILNMNEDKNWYKTEQDGHEGLIPANYIQMKDISWFHGKISRSEAEILLEESCQADGAFLIRESESTLGDFSLSVRYQGSVQHLKVLRDGAGKYFLWVVKFNSLNQLVDYHRTSSVSRSQTVYLKDMNKDGNNQIQKARALFDFEAAEDGELSFKKGDEIQILGDVDANWSRGKTALGEGLFPMTYVTLIKDN